MRTEAAAAFWSYTHLDDAAERGRIVQLAQDLRSEYGLLTGGPLELFLDKDAIAWGDDWRERITQALAGASFFIPILTPTYLTRPECRRELMQFAEQAHGLGVNELLLPILYSPISELEEDGEATDDVLRLVEVRQWEDWRELRLEDPLSSAYRKGIYRLARRLAATMRQLTSPEGVAEASARVDKGDAIGGEAVGARLLDLVAAGGNPVSRVGDVLGEFEPVLTDLARIANEARDAASASNQRGFVHAGALRAANQVGERLMEPASSVQMLGVRSAAAISDAGPSLRLLLDVVESSPMISLRDSEVVELLRGLLGVAAASRVIVTELQQVFDYFESSLGYSRALRPALRNLQHGLQSMLDAQAVFDDWEPRISKLLRYTEINMTGARIV